MSDIAKMIAIAKRFGGGGSAPSEAVILPETEIAVVGAEIMITTAPNAVPGAGAVCKVTYNGTAYDCPAVAIPVEMGMTGVALGATDALGIPGGNATAPFVVVLVDTPIDLGGVPVYGMLNPMEEFAEGTSITLSIVQTEGSGSSSGEQTLIVTAKYTDGAYTVDKAFPAVIAALNGSTNVEFRLIDELISDESVNPDGAYYLRLYVAGFLPKDGGGDQIRLVGFSWLTGRIELYVFSANGFLAITD